MSIINRQKGLLIALCLCVGLQASAQIDIFQVMEQKNLRIDQIEGLAKRYFDSTGIGKGSGHKQYQRWLYEAKFHLDENGYILPPDHDWKAYEAIKKDREPGMETHSAGSWTEKGPYGWTRTSGWNPGVGRITSLSVYASNPLNIYVTSPGGGVWKTTNGGSTWLPLTDANSNWMNMYSVAVDQQNVNTVLAGTNGGIIIKSTDGGSSWVQTNTGMGNVWKIMYHPTNNQLVYAAAGNGIYKSTNAGNTWIRTSTTSTQDIEFKPDDSNTMYAAGNSVLRSTDGGNAWTTLSSTNGIVASARTLIGVTPANPNIVYLVQANGNSFGYFYKSTDAGQNFTVMVTGSSTACTNYFGYETNGCGTGGQAGYDMAICVSNDNENEVYIAGIIVWKTINGGSNFTAMTAWSLPNTIGYNHADVHALEWVNSSIYSGSDGGIYRSNDRGDNWTDLSTGLGIRQFYRIANSKTVSTTFSGGAQDNGSSIHKATGWIDWLGADGMDCIISPLDANLQWGTSQYGSLYRTTNGGSSYSSITEPATGNWVTPLAIQSNANTIYAGWNDVYRSTDNGTTWTNLTGSLISSNIVALAVAPSNPNYIYASIGTILYTSTNGGSTWTTSTALSSINAIAVNPTNPARVWIVCNSSTNSVFVSDNAGLSFTNKSTGFPATTPRTITVDDDANESVYVGANIGVYYANNTQSTWLDLTDNLPKVAINEVEIQKSGLMLRIATYGRGVWERPLYAVVAPCNAPPMLSSTNITGSAAQLSWFAVGNAVSYTLEFKAASASTWEIAAANLTTTLYNLNNLQQNTLYEWRVLTNCTDGISSYANAQFTTLASCPSPNSLNTTGITTNAATLNWLAAPNATSYYVEYKTSSATSWTIASTNATGTSLALGGLLPATIYQWQIRSNCSSITSTIASAQFTTAALPVCNDVYENNNTSSQAKTITANVAINAAIGTTSDVDWFKISMGNNANTRIKLTLSNLPADYDVFLYNKNLALIGSSSQTGTTNEVVIYNTTTKRATYYIKVQGKSGAFNAASCYNLLLQSSSTPWTGEAAPLMVQSDVEKASIYPNPASNRALFTFNSEKAGFADICIISGTGIIMQTFGVQVRQGTNQITLETNALKPGLYLVQAKNNDMRIIKPMVIIK